MPGMPHVVEIGPLLDVLSDRYTNASIEERKRILHHYYHDPLVTPNGENVPQDQNDPTKASYKQSIASKNLDDESSQDDLMKRTWHMNKHWFGLEDPTAPAPSADDPVPEPLPPDHTPAFEPRQPAGDTTGWWRNWRGDAHGIFRETMIRALEASMGLDHWDPDSGTTYPHDTTVPARQWPIQFLWFCPSPKFEGWVTWRRTDLNGNGMVTACFTTPGVVGSDLSRSLLASSFDPPYPGARLVHAGDPYREPEDRTTAVYKVEEDWEIYADTNAKGPDGAATGSGNTTPQFPGSNQGILVIGHAETFIQGAECGPGQIADWSFGSATPYSIFDGSQSPIVCIAPDAKRDGGLRPATIEFKEITQQ